MKIGVFGGTFDPIHLGHLIVAEEARMRLGLDKVLFVPVGQPWLKVDRTITQAGHRVNMINLAITTNSYFQLSTIETDRPGVSYTVDTMSLLRKQFGPAAEFLFILGWDSLAELHQWKEPARLIKMCKLVAVPRPGYSPPHLKALEVSVSGITQSTIWLDMPVIGISSSNIRQRVAQGLSIRYLVPDKVAEYIKEQGLYL